MLPEWTSGSDAFCLLPTQKSDKENLTVETKKQIKNLEITLRVSPADLLCFGFGGWQ